MQEQESLQFRLQLMGKSREEQARIRAEHDRDIDNSVAEEMAYRRYLDEIAKVLGD